MNRRTGIQGCAIGAAVAAIAAVTGWLAAAAASPTPAKPDRPGWNSYQPIMWSTGEAPDPARWFARLREMGCTAEECGAGRDSRVFARNGFGFYVENLIPQLCFLNARRPIYDADFAGYTKTRDKQYLVRKPCLDDPAFWSEMERTLPELIHRQAANHPLLYNLRDELSIGSFASPMDYCFCPHTLAAFREWLHSRYGTVGALNGEWDTHFAGWDEVVPLTTYEMKDRERAALAAGKPENYAPWADHREYMDLSFARTLDRLRGMIRRIDPATPVGIEGTQMPSAWGGYDLWRLSRAVDWVEPYDIAHSREVWGSFLPRTAPVLSTAFGTDYPRVERELWTLLLEGDGGTIIWEDEKSRCVDRSTPSLPLTERGKKLGDIFTRLKPISARLADAQPLDDRIAIHYSQASIRAHWMFDSREDRETWPRRFSSYEATHSRFARDRDGMVRVVQDLGFRPKFVSYEQIEGGELTRAGYRILLLPQSVAMSAKECAQVEAFVRAGGTVIADNMAATMDEHCRRLPQGQLDALFGVRDQGRTWHAEPAGAPVDAGKPGADPLRPWDPIHVTTGVPGRPGQRNLVVEHRIGKGRAVFLNLDVREYGRQRLEPGKEGGLKRIFAAVLGPAPVKVLRPDGSPLPCAGVWRFRQRDAEYIAVMRTPERNVDSLGAAGATNNAALERPERVRVVLGTKGRVTDLRTGKPLGTAGEVMATLDRWSPLILEVRPVSRSGPGSPHPRPARASDALPGR